MVNYNIVGYIHWKWTSRTNDLRGGVALFRSVVLPVGVSKKYQHSILAVGETTPGKPVVKNSSACFPPQKLIILKYSERKLPLEGFYGNGISWGSSFI